MIQLDKTVIGIELGSTLIKAVLIDSNHKVLASGAYRWENQLVDGIWTYPMNEIHAGIQTCYADLKRAVRETLGVELGTVGAIGVSAMMHGYLPFDKHGKLLTPFRTWRNTITEDAAEKLTDLFGFNIPQRWSIAHLYQAMLNQEEHIKDIACLTTLAGYIHWKLTGKHILGIGDASGVFPIDTGSLDYDNAMLQKFDALHDAPWRLADILPKPLPAGENGGFLTEEGALFLDPSGTLKPGVPVAPCEGDAGTGMVATNAVRPKTGNVSAGTSDFAMIVADHELGVHREIDVVTTPSGLPVAMVHCNNCTSDINAWVELFSEFASAIGAKCDKGALYTLLFNKALEGEKDGGGLLNYNYFSGEGVTALNEGRPLFVRTPDAVLNLSNFMRTQLMSALATLKIGLDILKREENVVVDRLCAHGGFFRTPVVGQRILSAAVDAPVTVMETAGEGGPYGMALLCAYMLWREGDESLEEYLDRKVFAGVKQSTLMAHQEDVDGFSQFLIRYKRAFEIERIAIETV